MVGRLTNEAHIIKCVLPLVLLALAVPGWGQTPPAPNQTATTDPCRTKIPDSITRLLMQRFSNYRLPLLTDSEDSAVEWNRDHGGNGCTLVGSADFNGDGRNDYAVGLAPNDRRAALVGVVLWDSSDSERPGLGPSTA